ncbi:Mitogen-activated protein kinase kinase kinase 1 [Armadillidium vulgare]|nr:Mitogen-activated protein kinase kinase kinase 1 [Armadillidium vulgare]
MVRVLQLSESNPLLIAGSLKDYEVEQLLRGWEERRKKAIRARERRTFADPREKFIEGNDCKTGRSQPSSPTGSAPGAEVSSCEEDAQCPICLMMMVEGESLVACEAGCRNLLHHHCMAVWAADRHAQGQPLLCPLCRAPWPSKSQPRLAPSRSGTPSPFSNYAHAQNSSSFQQHYSMMSASFSGSCANGRQSPPQTPTLMSRSLSSAYPNSSRSNRSQNDSAYSSPNLGRSPVFGYPPTIRGEISSTSFVRSASEDMIPLPRSEPIPSEHEETAAAWVYVFGRELIACLFSRDWAVRETGLRRLAHEACIFFNYDFFIKINIIAYRYVMKVLHWDCLVTTEQMQQKIIHCCANILAQVANDPVYKVYLACLVSNMYYRYLILFCFHIRCVRVLLSHLCPEDENEVASFQELLRPLVHTLLLKCADGNRRTSQISIDSIVELSRGQRGELALGTQSKGSNATPGLGGISYVLSCILEDSPPTEAPWQWLLGRLCVLDRLLDEFPQEFQLQMVELSPAESGYKLQHYDRLMTVVEFAFKALGSSHATVSKLARRIYICGARMAATEPAVFNQVCDMLAKLDVSLQMRLKRRLKSMQSSHGERRSSLARLGEKFPLPTKENSSYTGPRLVRSVSHSPSRMLSALRSNSQSPARPVLLKNSSKGEENTDPTFQQKTSPRRPNHLPLDSFDAKFKEKQAKLRLYHKTRARNELPLIVQQTLISPGCKDKQMWSTKNSKTLFKQGLSHSYGDDLDLSPQTPITSVSPPHISFKDAISTPATPSAPYSTPVKENFSEKGIQVNTMNEQEEKPLPAIPGLDLIPKYLDENADLSEGISNITPYEEGKDWIKGPLLGTGAFSSCYQARDVHTGTLMAVKQLSVCRNSEEEQERVEAAVEEEIIMMSKLRHTNIVRLLGATRVASSFSVFSEWMAGGSVAGMLEKYGAFSEYVIIKYTKQIFGGLSYLHDNMILHRDLKGANLLVDSTGQCLRIGDFGTAARLASKSTVTGEFQGQLLGTIAFMAPEVLRGDNYGRACDVWSVGCCIIEMATTKPPWGAENVSNQYKLMFRIATSSAPPAIPDFLTGDTREIALKCLQINSEDRPPAKEFLQHSVFADHPP